jgi:hypothetical protein
MHEFSTRRCPSNWGVRWLAGFCLMLSLTGTARAGTETIDHPVAVLDRLEGDWTRIRTPSVRLYVEPRRLPGLDQLNQLESEVDRIARSLQLSRRVRASLAQEPIQYVLTRDVNLIRILGGIEAEGIAFAAQRLIISTRLPHTHELVHVLMQLSLECAASANVPFLQEGLASALAGHASEAPPAVFASADAVFAQRHVDIRRLLSYEGFHRSNLDDRDRYAVAARFVDYLFRDGQGWPELRELLRILAGATDELKRRPVQAVVNQFEGVYDRDFDDLIDDFHRWRVANPATSSMLEFEPQRAADAVVSDERHLLRFWDEGDRWVFALRASQGALDAEVGWGEIVEFEGLAASPVTPRRFSLWVDRQGASLRDRQTHDVLMRWVAPPLGGDDALDRSAVFTLDPAVVGSQPPRAWSLWSRPTFDPR